MAGVLDVFIPKLEALTTVTGSVIALVKELVRQIKAAPTIAEAQAIADQFGARADEIAAAVKENTPAEEQPV